MSTENIETPEVEADVSETSEVDADEAEYQAKMKEIKGVDSDSDGWEVEELDPNEEGIDEEEKEYREALLKARGNKDKDAVKDKSNPKEGEKKDTKNGRRIIKIKVNGREEEFDATDDKAVAAEIQKGRAAEEKWQAAAKVQKQAHNFVSALQKDFMRVLTNPNLGIDKKELRSKMEEYLYSELQRDSMSAEEKDRHARDEELERLRQSEELRKQREKQREDELKKESLRQNWAKKFQEAMDEAGLPKTRFTLNQMAHYMRLAVRKGYRNIEPKDVVADVRADWIDAQRQIFSMTDDQKLIDLLGQENVDRVRKANLKRLDSNNAFKESSAPSARTVSRPQKQERSYSSVSEMMRDIKKSA